MIKTLAATIIIALTTATFAIGQEVKVMTFDEFQRQELNKKHDKLYVYNFWATWCKPCVKELPYFEKINSMYGDKVEVVLVSLDFVKQLDSKLKPFVKENKLQSDVILLNDTKYNTWIDKVSSEWSGSIPATLMLNNSGEVKAFYEKEFTFEQLEKEIRKHL